MFIQLLDTVEISKGKNISEERLQQATFPTRVPADSEL